MFSYGNGDSLVVKRKKKKFLFAIPQEVFNMIFDQLNLVSLLNLSATCNFLRSAVHRFLIDLISSRATRYIEVKESLARLGWKKEHEDIWHCKCFQIVAGPCFMWEKIARKESFSINDFKFGTKITRATEKFFFVSEMRDSSFVDIRYRIALESNGTPGQGSSLDSFSEHTPGVDKLVSYDNTLALCVRELNRTIMDVVFRIIIYNSGSLQKIDEFDPLDCYVVKEPHDENGMTDPCVMEIAMSKDTLIVHLALRYMGVWGRYDANTQIWAINTNNPVAYPEDGSIMLLKLIEYPLFIGIQLDEDNLGIIGLNDKFLVRLGQPEYRDELLLQVFRSDLAEEREGYDGPERAPLLIYPEGDRNGAEWKRAKISLEGGQGDHIALSLLFRNEDGVMAKIQVQVFSASRGELIIQREFDTFGDSDPSCQSRWFGPHLVVPCKMGSHLHLHSWQSGLENFFTSPLKMPVVGQIRIQTKVDNFLAGISSVISSFSEDEDLAGLGWSCDCLWLDYGNVTTATYWHWKRTSFDYQAYVHTWGTSVEHCKQ